MTIYIILTIAGTDVGPFDLYSNVTSPTFGDPAFKEDVSRADLVAGYTTTAPDGTTQVKVQSTGNCTNSIIIDLGVTTTSTSSTTTTTTTSPATTTTTTTSPELFYRVTQCPPLSGDFVIAKTQVVAVGDNLVFNTIPTDGNNYCGQVIADDFPTGPVTATLVSAINYACNDDIHCYQAPL